MSFDDDAFARRTAEPEKSNKTCLILGLIGGGFVALMLLCGGCCFFGMQVGFDELETQVVSDLSGNPVVDEHLDNIESAELDFWKSVEQQQTQGGDAWVFRVTGSKASGTLYVDGLEPGNQFSTITAGELELDSGETYDLFGPEEEILLPSLDILPEEALNDAPLQGIVESDESSGQIDEFTRQVRDDIAEHPVILEHIGEITGIEQDTERSIAEPGPDVYVFKITGSKAFGLLRADCRTVSAEEEDVVAGELIVDSGERFQLFPDNPLE